MKLIERYIFLRVGRAFLLSLVVLSVTVWLTQALREFDLVSSMGQSIGVFFQITLLLMPALTTVVAPVALMIAVIYAYTTLNDGSELVVINASGARQWSLLKPVLLVAVGASIFMASMTLYFSPLSLRLWRQMITNVQGSVLTSIVREGQFLKLANGLTFQLRSRSPDGTLRGIFLSDSREKGETVTYVAERGAVLESPVGMFLVMSDGTIQRSRDSDKSIAIIQFTSYAFDLSSFSSRTEVKSYKPNEQPTGYLLDPNPNDRDFQRNPQKYMAELHTRFSTPLNAFIFSIIPLLFLAQAESTRQRRGVTMSLAVGTTLGVAVIEFLLSGPAGESLVAAVALYLVPIAATAIAVALILAGVQPRPPEALLAFNDRVAARVKGLFARRRPALAARAR